MTSIRFTSLPKTQPPPAFVEKIIAVFTDQESAFATKVVKEAKDSNGVLSILRPGLVKLGFQVEESKYKAGKIERPVFYGENGVPTLRYQIDAYHDEWRCGLEVEAGRAWMGNAVYRDLIQAMVMVQVDHLCLAVPNEYRYQSGGKPTISQDYANTLNVVDALYGHSRVKIPYGLTLIGY
jgi:hypothetical protein